MSFSLVGLRPKSEVEVSGGSRFKAKEERAQFDNNVWWWRPLWFTAGRFAELDKETVVNGQFNDEVIEEKAALKVADALEALVNDADRWKEWVQWMREHYPRPYNQCLTRKNTRKFIKFCRECGGFWTG